MSDRDFSAIATWEWREDDNDSWHGRSTPFLCTQCEWTGGTRAAVDHHRETGHALRGKHWPTGMIAQFSDAGSDGRRK